MIRSCQEADERYNDFAINSGRRPRAHSGVDERKAWRAACSRCTPGSSNSRLPPGPCCPLSQREQTKKRTRHCGARQKLARNKSVGARTAGTMAADNTKAHKSGQAPSAMTLSSAPVQIATVFDDRQHKPQGRHHPSYSTDSLGEIRGASSPRPVNLIVGRMNWRLRMHACIMSGHYISSSV
jgi:hypothetical protein